MYINLSTFKRKLYTTQKSPGQGQCLKAKTHIATMRKLQHVYTHETVDSAILQLTRIIAFYIAAISLCVKALKIML